jgi:hypothetical protein
MWTLHTTLAAIAKAPELAIDPKEADRLVAAWEHVAEAYGVPEISEKTAATMELIGVAGAVYIPRLVAIGIRRKANRPAIVKPFPANTAAAIPANQQRQTTEQARPNGAAKDSTAFDALNMTPQESSLQ